MLSMADKTYRISVFWDNEAEVFVAHSDDIYGLNTEAESLPKLMRKVHDAALDLLEINEETDFSNSFLFDPQSFVVPFKAQSCG